MTSVAPNSPDEAADLEAAVNQVLAICDGDARAAIRALIVANHHLEEEAAQLREGISYGFLYGRFQRRN